MNNRNYEYPKQKKGFTLRSQPTKQFGMANSVPTVYYGKVSLRLNGFPTIEMSESPIVIKSKGDLEQAINFLQSSGILPLYCYLVVTEVQYVRSYFPYEDKQGNMKQSLADCITRTVNEHSLEKGTPTFNIQDWKVGR